MSPIITTTTISFKFHGIYANMDEAVLLPVLLVAMASLSKAKQQ
jgi:hypothetical protein